MASVLKEELMSLIYVFAASKMEGRPVEQISHAAASRKTLFGVATSYAGGNEVVLITGGMGLKGARAKATQALGLTSVPRGQNGPPDRKPHAVLVIGLCGALSSSLPEAGIVTYTNCQSTDPNQPPLRCSRSIADRLLQSLVSQGVPCDSVVGITSARIAVTKDEKLELAKFGASVVDMETYEILAAAASAGVPAAVLRVISDSLDRRMPDFNRALNQDGGIDAWQALRVVAGAPLLAARLLAANRRALRQFAKAMTVVLLADCFASAISS